MNRDIPNRRLQPTKTAPQGRQIAAGPPDHAQGHQIYV